MPLLNSVLRDVAHGVSYRRGPDPAHFGDDTVASPLRTLITTDQKAFFKSKMPKETFDERDGKLLPKAWTTLNDDCELSGIQLSRSSSKSTWVPKY